MRKRFFVFLTLFLFSFDFSCKKDYEKSYESAYRYYSQGDIENMKKAVDEFSKVFFYILSAINGKYDALMALGVQYREQNLYTEAIDVFEKAHRIMPKEVKPYYELGNAYMNYALVSRESEKEALFKKAEENLLAGYQIKNDDISINASLGRYYGFIRKDLDRGVEHLKKVLESEARDYGARLALGTLYVQKKDYANAMDAYIKVKQTAPEESLYFKQASANIEALNKMIAK